MLSSEAQTNLKRFYLEIVTHVEDPRLWIQYWVNREKSYLRAPEIIDQLLIHLNDFLCIPEMYECLDLGGIYTCETIWEGSVTKWEFKFGQDNPWRASLILRALPMETDRGFG